MCEALPALVKGEWFWNHSPKWKSQQTGPCWFRI